jgi:hypothetical protein
MAGGVNFAEQLAKQIRFLETSCREYDAGNLEEGIRIAVALRVIFHHTAKSTSLLVHMGASYVKVLSTAGRRVSDHPRVFWPPLVQIVYNVRNNTLQCNPTFNIRSSAHRFIPAAAWWNGEMVFFGCGKKFKRSSLVLHAANKDGGAHVDGTIPPDYEWLINGADVAFGYTTADGRDFINKLPNPHLAYLRQMAHEILSSPELLKLAGR